MALLGFTLAYAAIAHGGSELRGTLPRSSVYPFSLQSTGPAPPVRARVVKLDPASAAAARGLKVGDLLLSVNGRPYSRVAEADRLLLRAPPGSEVVLQIERDGRPRTVRITASPAPLQQLAGLDIVYDVLDMPDGTRLRTILTRPENASGNLPTLYFVPWLSCDPIERPLNLEDEGWQRMLERVAGIPGVMLMRVEKSGVGDSEGPECWELEYDMELTYHREALRRLRDTPGVDSSRIVIYGASMGGNMAAILAAETKPAGLIIWGTAIKSWLEHLIEFNRRSLELSGHSTDEVTPLVSAQTQVFIHYVVHQRSPAEITAQYPDLAAALRRVRGLSDTQHYGRPLNYHRQAQRQNWLSAVDKVRSPTLVMYGEHDWFETLDDHLLIARTIERNVPGGATLVVVPRMNHHFSIFHSLQKSHDLDGGVVASELVANEIAAWLRKTGIVDSRAPKSGRIRTP